MIAPIEYAYAQQLDNEDQLASFRSHFHFPRQTSGKPIVYLCGNSLGLQPLNARESVLQELDKWAQLGVEGHFEKPDPWFHYHEFLQRQSAMIVGAKEKEVVVMGSLTANLHLLMVSFYQPTSTRYRIAIEADAFPSDKYAVASQARFHGYDPDDAIIVLKPRDGEDTLRTEDIEATLREHGDSLALVMLGGVNFYTGQVFDIKHITHIAHSLGAKAGFDLAHAAGNVPLQLHDWDVDFAAWCTYKYLNSGPGGVASCFVHERYKQDPTLPRFAGWWGNDPSVRFEMPETFTPQEGAAGWQLSNAPILPMASLRGSLDLFEQAGMSALRQKSLQLTDYLLQLLQELPGDNFSVLTPTASEARGSQVSIRMKDANKAESLSVFLRNHGIVCDVRHDVIRAAPAPLYNSFVDVWHFYDALRQFTS